MSFDASWEEKIYAQKKHINRYPYGELVSIFFNSLKFLPKERLENKKSIKILELGCGSGNNLWFFSELGFDVYGVDGSQSACSIAKELLLSKNLKANVQQCYFDKLPFDDESIDIIIDRESTYCGKLEDIKRWWREADRVLKKGGLVISFKFSDDNPDLPKLDSKEIKALKLEKNTYTDIENGTFADTGVVHFCTYEELFEIFSFCDIKFINKNSSQTIYDTVNNQFYYSEWIVVGVKK